MYGQVATGPPKCGTPLRAWLDICSVCGEVQESRTSSSTRTISFGDAFWPLGCAASLTVRPS